jgi:DNA-binding NarL/FixJ family response regulator
VRVLVAEDQQLVRAGLVTMLRVTPGFEVVAEVGDGRAAVDAARRTTPDVALLDLRMPVMSGIEATEAILAAVPGTKVLALTTFGTEELLFEALEAGASGFLLKDVAPEQLVEAVAAVARGEGRLDPAVTATVVRHFRRSPRRPAPPEPVERLTPREEEVLTHLARGLSNAELAATLHLSEATVKTHVARILGKLGLRDRAQAVVVAYETGLVSPGEGGVAS